MSDYTHQLQDYLVDLIELCPIPGIPSFTKWREEEFSILFSRGRLSDPEDHYTKVTRYLGEFLDLEILRGFWDAKSWSLRDMTYQNWRPVVKERTRSPLKESGNPSIDKILRSLPDEDPVIARASLIFSARRLQKANQHGVDDTDKEPRRVNRNEDHWKYLMGQRRSRFESTVYSMIEQGTRKPLEGWAEETSRAVLRRTRTLENETQRKYLKAFLRYGLQKYDQVETPPFVPGLPSFRDFLKTEPFAKVHF